jgi:hypothetical protein
MAIENGIKAKEFNDAKNDLFNKYSRKTIAGIKIGEIYADFE